MSSSPTDAIPLLSVIMPVHNVGSYLAPALESVLACGIDDAELICIDNASTDGSAELVEDFARRDPRVRLIRLDTNGSPGRARNIGLDAARGRFLAFADPDDRVPEGAYRHMIAALEQSGSDLVTGRVARFSETDRYDADPFVRAIPHDSHGTHITRTPSLVYDTTVLNKLYCREFLERHALRFPEGGIYEDMPYALTAHLLADRVDALAATFYERRIRGEPRSITQRRRDPADLADRLSALQRCTDLVIAHGNREVAYALEEKALTHDIPLYLAEFSYADRGFQDQVVERVGHFLHHVRKDSLRALPVWDQVAYDLIARGHRAELAELIAERDARGRRYEVRRIGRRLYADVPYLRDRAVGVPDATYDVTDRLQVHCAVENMCIDGDTLVVRGHGFADGLPMRHPAAAVRYLELVGGTGHRISVPAMPHRRPDITAERGQRRTSYTWSGFSARIPLGRLHAPDGEQVYQVQLRIVTPWVKAGAALRAQDRVESATGPLHLTSAGTYVSARAGDDGDLRITARRDVVLVESARFSEAALTCVLRLPRKLKAPSMVWNTVGRVPDVKARIALHTDDPLRATATFDLASFHPIDDTKGTRRVWHAVVQSGAVRSPVVLAPGLATGQAGDDLADKRPLRELAVRGGEDGALTLLDRRFAVRIRSAEWLGGTLRLRLTPNPASPIPPNKLTVRLRNATDTESVPATTRVDGADLIADIEVTDAAGYRSLSTGMWSLRVYRPEGDTRKSMALEVDRTVATNLARRSTRLITAEVHAQPLELNVRLNVRLTSGRLGDRGQFNQERLRKRHYSRARRRPLRDAVVFQSWAGSQVACNPRAIYDEILRQERDLPLLWVRRDPAAHIPDGVPSVLLGSREYYEALATARFLVANDTMPEYYVKRSGARYLQTWHGTPLKRIGLDIERVLVGDGRYLRRVEADAARWDQLISPNPYATEVFRRAFRFTGEILETGYPRNDVFHSPDVQARGAAVRARLGLRQDQRVILWAPTSRDDQRDDHGRITLSLPFGLATWDGILGEDDILLFRGHHQVTAAADVAPRARTVRNVTGYPDIQDLYLAADLLITDYSSAMFDFANTRRPMIFYAWDLETYRDEVRGLYLDFEAEAPGPIVTTLDGLRAALDDVSTAAASAKARYEAFAARFCAREDGQSAERVVNAMFGQA